MKKCPDCGNDVRMTYWCKRCHVTGQIDECPACAEKEKRIEFLEGAKTSAEEVAKHQCGLACEWHDELERARKRIAELEAERNWLRHKLGQYGACAMGDEP